MLSLEATQPILVTVVGVQFIIHGVSQVVLDIAQRIQP